MVAIAPPVRRRHTLSKSRTQRSPVFISSDSCSSVTAVRFRAVSGLGILSIDCETFAPQVDWRRPRGAARRTHRDFRPDWRFFQAGAVWHTRCRHNSTEAVDRRLTRPRVEETMTPETTSPSSSDRPAYATVAERAAARLGDSVGLDSCSELEWITVKTSGAPTISWSSQATPGRSLVRGGSLFLEFRRATITGSLFGGIAVKLRTIAVGFNLSFWSTGCP